MRENEEQVLRAVFVKEVAISSLGPATTRMIGDRLSAEVGTSETIMCNGSRAQRRVGC